VETGDEMPAGTDAVASLDAIVIHGEVAEAAGPVTPGESVAPAGSEAAPSKPLRKSGERLRNVDAAVLTAAGIAQMSVRAPRILIVAAREDLRLMPPMRMIARDCAARGGIPILSNGMTLDDALHARDCDAIIIVGGTGTGARDVSVTALARLGKVVVHGIGLTPGETAAVGDAGGCPVLVVPGRIDGALANWLVLGRPMLARLAGHNEPEQAVKAALSRKVTSTVGLAEVVPVRHDGASAEPLATRHLPLWVLASANGWLLAPPDSEGYPTGAQVTIHTWPGN
jgi:molybdopterin biosynthesis enzyme